MTAAASYQTLVEELYVAYFGRPSDYYGLQNFESALAAANAPTTLSGLLAAYNTNTTIASLVNLFGTSEESQTLYGAVTKDPESAASFVNSVFQNLFNRSPATSGLNFWVNALVTGQITAGNAALQIAAGAFSATGSTTDQSTFNNKVTVASNFTTALTTTSDIIGYAGSAAAASARQLLAGVTATTVPTTYQTTVLSTIAAIAGAAPGTPVYLTTGVDNVSGSNFQALVTTAATGSTLNTFDTLTGTAAVNVLTIEVNGNAPIPTSGVTLHNIQTVDVNGSAQVSLNLATASGFAGVSALNVQGSTGNDSITVGSGVVATVTDSAGKVTLAGGASQTVTTAGGVVLSGAVGAINAIDSSQGAANSTIDGGTNVSLTATDSTSGVGGTIIIGGTTAPTGTITVVDNINESTTTPASITGGAITVNGGTTVSITEVATPYTSTTGGAANFTVTEGAVTVDGGKATTSVAVAETASVAEANTIAAVAGKGAADVLTFSAMTTGQTITVDGLKFTANTTLTASQVAAAFANLGNSTWQGNSTGGTYSLADSGNFTSGAVGGTTAAPTVTFTAKAAGAGAAIVTSSTGATAPTVSYTAGALTVTAAGAGGVTAGAVTISDLNYGTATAGTIATVSLSGTSNGATISSDALTSLSLTNGAGTVTVNDHTATTLALALSGEAGTVDLDGVAGTYKTLNVTTAGTTASSVVLTATGVTALTVAGTETLALGTMSSLTALKTVTVTGSAGVDADLHALANLVDFNAKGTSGVNTVTLNGSVATYEGGSGGDTLTLSSSTVTKAITMGAGNDTVILASGTVTAPGTITGGAGTNTLQMVAADAVTASASSTFATQVTNFQDLSLTGGTGAQTVHVDTLGGYNTVITGGEAAAVGSVLTLTGFASGGTLDLISSTAGGSYVVTNSAWTSSAPAASFNIDLSSHGVDVSAGSVTASNVTAINISAVDTKSADPAGTLLDSLTLVDTAATTIKVTGNADLQLTNTGNTAVTSIDASGMTGSISVQAAGTVAETIKGGAAGHNVLAASTGSLADTLIGGAGGHDTFISNQGLDTLTAGGSDNTYDIAVASLNSNSYADITKAAVGDTIEFGAAATTFSAAGITLAPTAVFQDYANAAIKNSAAGGVSWFQYGGNTYIVDNVSAGTSFVNGTDYIVELTGLVSLSHTSLNTTHHSLLIG